MSEKHAYSGKTVNAVIALKVISVNFSGQMDVLSGVQTNWTPAYATDLGKRVDTMSGKFLGIRARDELFKATITLNQLIAPAKDDLETVKLNIKIHYKGDKIKQQELLSDLGFATGKTVSGMNHSELVELLTKFKRGMTPDRLADLTAKGLPAEVVNRIIDAVVPISEANAIQENLKTSTKEATDAVIKEINSLYTEIIGICKFVADRYKRTAVKKEMFTFSRIMHNLGEPHETPGKKKEKKTPEK